MLAFKLVYVIFQSHSCHPEQSKGSLPFEEGQCDLKHKNYKGEVAIIPHYARDKDSSLRSE
jgi:hypothetical protein